MPQLIHLADDTAGITRHKAGKGFVYRTAGGAAVAQHKTLARIRALVIPPAWTDVWISPSEHSHLQATGRDARGRKQYRYHAAFRAAQEEQKFDHLTDFAKALPDIRRTVRNHLRKEGLPRERVLATIVHLLETTLIRVGNEDYARSNQSYGLTTLRDPHVDIRGSSLRFHFKGKSGKAWELKVTDRRVAKIVKACQDLPGQHLFQYRDAEGALHDVSSGDVNAYLREISGREVTAKIFRTWAGTVLAATALSHCAPCDSETAAKRAVRGAIEEVAARLGNTVTVCRKCYVHPVIVDTFMRGDFTLARKRRLSDDTRLSAEESAVLTLLRKRPTRGAQSSVARAA